MVQAQILDQYSENKARLQPKIEYYALKWHTSSEVMNYIVDHESGYDKANVGDIDIKCRRTGEMMEALGLVQINNCYWPKITKEQAQDEDFALNFLAKWLSRGHCSYWSTCPTNQYLAIR